MASPLDLQRLEIQFSRGMSALDESRQSIQELRDSSAAGSVARARFVNLHRNLSEHLQTIAEVASVPGISDYAAAQLAGQVDDFGAWAGNAISAVQTVRAWLWSNLVSSVNAGTITVIQYPEDGINPPVQQIATTGQTATFRTAADAALSALNADG